MNDTMVTPSPPGQEEQRPLSCPACACALTGEPNFCPACGNDLRGIGSQSDTLSGSLKSKLIDGRYKLLEKLGEGGMGSVFKVEHVRMGKMAALKLMRPDAAVDASLKARFLQEARVVAKLSHPNTVQVFDTGELDDGSLYIAMEFVAGKDLAWHLRSHGPMTESKVVAIAVQILASLQEAHEAGIVHRDIKPANVMLVRRKKGEDVVKLLDFGIAKLLESEARKSTTGDFVGTPAYMSPEQIRGEGIDARSDLYSLGAMLFELVTGRQLFIGSNPISIVQQHAEAAPPRIAEIAPTAQISPAFEAIIMRSLAKNPADRFADADAMKEALQTARPDLGIRTGDFATVTAEQRTDMLSREDFDRFERTMRFWRIATPLLAFSVLAGGAAFAWHTYSNAAPPEFHTREREPNEHPKEATRISLSTEITGAIGAAPADQQDRDLYVVQVPRGVVRATLSGVPDLNLTMELLQLEKTDTGERIRRKIFLDDVGVGEAERVDGLSVNEGALYVRVEEKAFCTEPNRPPRERGLVPYTLRVDVAPATDGELEPNDTASTAQALPLTFSTTAIAGAVLDDPDRLTELRPDAPFSTLDWFKVDADPAETVAIVIVPPERGALEAIDGATLEAWNKRVAASSPRAPRPPPPTASTVRGTPLVLELKPTPSPRRVRIVASKDVIPGSTYIVAPITSGPNGFAALLKVAAALKERNQDASHRVMLEAALKLFDKAPERQALVEALNEGR